MSRKWLFRLLGLSLIGFCAITWAWMLGGFSYLSLPGIGANNALWLNPGILSMPATLATIAGVVGSFYLTGVLPYFECAKNEDMGAK